MPCCFCSATSLRFSPSLPVPSVTINCSPPPLTHSHHHQCYPPRNHPPPPHPLLLITIIIIISCPPSCLLRKSCYKLRREPTQPIGTRSLSLHLWQSFFRLLVRCNGLVSLVNNYGDFHNITIAAFSSQPIDSRSLSLEKEKKK